jgi:hypothetical protein
MKKRKMTVILKAFYLPMWNPLNEKRRLSKMNLSQVFKWRCGFCNGIEHLIDIGVNVVGRFSPLNIALTKEFALVLAQKTYLTAQRQSKRGANRPAIECSSGSIQWSFEHSDKIHFSCRNSKKENQRGH